MSEEKPTTEKKEEKKLTMSGFKKRKKRRDLSPELKKKIVAQIANGGSQKDLAKKYDISATTISGWMADYRYRYTEPKVVQPKPTQKPTVNTKYCTICEKPLSRMGNIKTCGSKDCKKEYNRLRMAKHRSSDGGLNSRVDKLLLDIAEVLVSSRLNR